MGLLRCATGSLSNTQEARTRTTRQLRFAALTLSTLLPGAVLAWSAPAAEPTDRGLGEPVVASPTVAQERRIAWVIGNGDDQVDVADLRNPGRDAEPMAATWWSPSGRPPGTADVIRRGDHWRATLGKMWLFILTA